VKYSIELADWPWTSEGEYLEVDIIVKLPGKRKAKRKEDGGAQRRPREFYLGDNATVIFSRKVEILRIRCMPASSTCMQVAVV